ncbi:MAG: phenylalanine--tRNA ligase subunit beta [Dehalococcoidia bacterium]
MLVSLKWLRDYVDLPQALDVDTLAHRLTEASSEVEGIRRVGGDWDRALVRVGEVLAVEPHPDADRLRLATVNYGGPAPQRVVCGAPNLAVGQRIAFGREGADLFDGHTGKRIRLKATRIRGVESAGMVLSERELGLSEEHEGIVELPADAPVGMPLADYLGDIVLDVHTWPNRADTMSMVGIARELAAIVGVSALRLPDESYAADGPAVADDLAIAIEDPTLCARYVATVVDGVTAGPSPAWMQDRLRAAGVRPISNVVDVTNYVMLELGQPLHAFDRDRMHGRVVVRTARPGEVLTTLDGQTRTLSPDTLLITDLDERGESRPIALAGVMGGEATEVTPATRSVLLEAARFDPTSIRRTSTRLGLRSEASGRFERGLSPELAMHAARRATRLLVELCGGTARSGVVDVYPAPPAPPTITLSRARLDTLLGMHVPTVEVHAILAALGFDVRASDDEQPDGRFVIRPPWWRTDVAIADDVAEEVVRLAGYERLPATTIRGRIPAWEPNPLPALRDRLRGALVRAGMQEVVTYSLTTDEVLARVMPPEDLAVIRPLRLRNTLSSDRQVMRPTLRHALIETVEQNIRAGAGEILVFEAGRAVIPRRDVGGPLPEEREVIVGAISGAEPDRWGRATPRRLDFFDAKGMLEAAMQELGVAIDYAADREYGLMPGRVARLSAGGEAIGVLGDVHPHTLRAFGVDQPVVLFEIELARLLPHVPSRGPARDRCRASPPWSRTSPSWSTPAPRPAPCSG